MAGVRRNLIATVYGTAAVTVGQVALVPLFLHAWGASVYGQWLVLTALPAYLSLSDVGIGNALGNSLSIAAEQGRWADARRLLGSVLRFQGLFGLGLLVLSAVATVCLPIGAWLKVDALNSTEAAAVLLALVVYALLPIQIGCFTGVYRAAGRYPRYILLQGHARVFEVALTAAVLLMGGGMLALAAALLVGRALWFAAVLVDARRLLPALEVRWSEGTWSDFRGLAGLGAGFFAFPVGNALVNQGVVLVVNHLGGAVAVVQLSVCRQVCRVFLQVSSMLFTSIHPELTVALARGDTKRAMNLQGGVLALVAVGGAIFVTGCAAWGGEVVHWWTRGVEVASIAMFVLAAEAVTASMANVALLAPWSTNQLGRLPIAYLVTQVAALVLTAGLFGRISVSAVGASFPVGNVTFGCLALARSLAVSRAGWLDFLRSAWMGLRYFAVAPFRSLRTIP